MKMILLLFMLIKYLESSPRLDPLVTTKRGLIKGLQSQNGEFAMFLGIPFGVVDENNPFGAATPHPGFTSTFEAYTDFVACPQYSSGASIGNINCLNLNIYVPNSASSANKLPVMFFLPGGAFIRGNGNMASLGPEFLVKHDVIIVTSNYRLGPYGFLCLDIPGYNNQGLKDQTLALNWVVDNIESFGGDDNQITAFGQSAGAMALDIHLLIEKPIFKRVILQSGTSISPWVVGRINNTIPINIAKKLGFETADVAAAVDFLKTADVSEVVRTANEHNILVKASHPKTTACVEQAHDEAFLTDFPVNLKPLVQDLDIMIGHNYREVSFIHPDLDKSNYENYKFGDELVKAFDYPYDENDVRHFYVGDEDPRFDLKLDILDYVSDFVCVHPVERNVQRYLENNAKSVYWFVFEYEGGRNRNKVRLNVTTEGAKHGDELGYLWEMKSLFGEEPNESDQKMINAMTKMWTDFAKYGNPTPDEPTDLIPVKWLPIEGDRRPYLRIDDPISLENRPFRQRMAFWDIYYKRNGGNIIGIKK